MYAHKHYANQGDKHANKHKTNQIRFLLFAKQNIKHICINNPFSQNMHINPKSFSPFLSIINKGLKTQSTNFFLPLFVINKEINKGSNQTYQ